MEVSKELKKWVDSLSMGEKRFIRLLGTARARAQDSQRLALLDWIENASDEDQIPPEAPFLKNLPAISDRLKDLILDGLHLLHKNDDIDAQLMTMLDETTLLISKKLNDAAMRTLRRGKKLALATSRYAIFLQMIDRERKLAFAKFDLDLSDQLMIWQEEEKEAMSRLAALQELQTTHLMLRMHERKVMAPRDATLLKQLLPLATSPVVLQCAETGNYLEQALATNILGMYDLLRRDLNAAVMRYEALLKRWQNEPKWQLDQGPLLLSICSFFQTACFYRPAPWDETQGLLRLLPKFDYLSPQEAFHHQRKLHVNNFLLALNTGNFDSLSVIMAEIDRWMQEQRALITPLMALPILNNLAVAEFILGNHSAANKYVQRILNIPDRNALAVIRNFALILQAILQYELGDSALNEYLTRSAKRHFQKTNRDLDFEMLVLRFLEKTLRVEHTDAMAATLETFIASLDALAEQVSAGSLAILGLMEVRLWARARQQQRSLKAVFLEAVQENLAALG